MTDDEKPWLEIARRINKGEFSGADRSTKLSLYYGLRRLRSPLATLAIKKLGLLKDKEEE